MAEPAPSSTTETKPSGPSLPTTPGLSPNLVSISPSDRPRRLSTKASRIVATGRSSRPANPDRPMASRSASAWSWMRRRASSTPSVALRADTSGDARGPAAVEDGDHVGLGRAMPICCRRAAKTGVMDSAGGTVVVVGSSARMGGGLGRGVVAAAGAEPGARVGNLRAPLCAALEAEAPMGEEVVYGGRE